MYRFLKYNKEPELISSRKPFLVDGKKTGWVEEEWYTKDIAVPEWWNPECHRMLEKTMIGGSKGLVKYCLRCKVVNEDGRIYQGKQIPENGCKHNI